MNTVVMSGGCVFSSSIICFHVSKLHNYTEAQSYNTQYFNYASIMPEYDYIIKKGKRCFKASGKLSTKLRNTIEKKNKHRSKTKLVQRTTRVQITEFQHIALSF